MIDLLGRDVPPAAYASISLREAEAAGFDGLEIGCGCKIQMLPFRWLSARAAEDEAAVAVAARLRCRKCGRRADLSWSRLWRQDDCYVAPKLRRPSFAECLADREAGLASAAAGATRGR